MNKLSRSTLINQRNALLKSLTECISELEDWETYNYERTGEGSPSLKVIERCNVILSACGKEYKE